MPPEIEPASLASSSASASTTTQAMVCGIRVSVQAVANTLCFSTTATLLTYTLVRLAMSASHRNRNYVIAAVTIFLVVWFTAGCTVYLAFCRTLHRRSMEERRRASGSSSNATLPQSDVKKRQAHGLDVLPRESPVHGRVTSASIIPACEQPDGEPWDDGRLNCAVCREEVERWEMATRFPACLHVFHQRCIDWRRLRMHSTCPVCRADAEAPLLDQRCKSDDLIWSLFSGS